MFRPVAESGYRTLETSQWYGILVPAKTPKAIIDKLAAATDKALKSSGITAKFARMTPVPAGVLPEQFATFIREQATWKHHRKPGLKIE